MLLGVLDNHVCYEFGKLLSCKIECLRSLELREVVLAYNRGVCFLVVDHMLPKRLLFVLGTPFVRSNMWTITVSTSIGFRDSLLGHPLCE